MNEKWEQKPEYAAFICPTCGKPLQKQGGSCRCENGHCVDYAKSGYLNLLMANQKHSQQPGDNKLMVDARRRFLEKGYYEPLLREVCRMVEAIFPPGNSRILDAGCGEGYYTGGIFRHLVRRGKTPRMLGVDISKTAIDKAAKLNRGIAYAVASVFHLPVANASCGMVLNLFAPYYQPEIERVLASLGVMLLVIPGEGHLWELKQFVYQEPYKNEVKEFELENFALEERRTVREVLSLETREDIDDLFKMTPYYYKTGREDYERLLCLNTFKTQAHFELLAYRKK